MTMKRFTPSTLTVLALVALATPAWAQPDTAQSIDVLVYYTGNAADHYDGEPAPRIRHLIDVANDVFTRSGVDARLRLAGLEATDDAGSSRAPVALTDITYGEESAFSEVATQRAAAEADVVLLIGTYLYDGYCGVAWQGGTEEAGVLSAADRAHAYAYVAIDCSVYTLVHEVGHLLGLAHSRLETPGAGTWPWAVGHGVEGVFTTIMATPDAFAAPRLPYFSSPELQDCLGHACGVANEDAERSAHAIKALRETLPQLAAYMAAEDGASAADAAAETEQQRISAADSESVKMSSPDADEAPDESAAVTTVPGKPKSADSTARTSDSTGSSTAPASSASTSTSTSTSPSATASSSGGGGGGCAMGAGHDDISLPFLLLTSLGWLRHRRRPRALVMAV